MIDGEKILKFLGLCSATALVAGVVHIVSAGASAPNPYAARPGAAVQPAPSAPAMQSLHSDPEPAEQQTHSSYAGDDSSAVPIAAWTPPADPNAGPNPWAKR